MPNCLHKAALLFTTLSPQTLAVQGKGWGINLMRPSKICNYRLERGPNLEAPDFGQ